MTDGIRLNDINIWINIPDELRTDIVTLPTSDKLLSDIPIFTSAYQRKILRFLEPIDLFEEKSFLLHFAINRDMN